jgi:flagellar biosynthesis protein FliR
MTGILISDFIIGLFIFLRIIAMIVALPILGHQAIPAVAKVFLAIILSYISFLTIDKSQIYVNPDFIFIVVNGVKEIITGLIMGYTLNLIFYGISYAGTLIGFDMGLMFAEVLDPIQGSSSNIVGEIIFYMAMIMFLMINGHHYVISALVASFKVIPLTKVTANEVTLQIIIKYSFTVFTIAVKIASPIIVAFFLVHLAEGIIARVIPNIQILFITQPVKIGLGFAFLAALAPMYVFAIKSLLHSYEDQLMELIKAMSS